LKWKNGMIALACLATAGFLMGVYFNSYTLVASCLIVALASVFGAFHVGLWQSSVTLALGLVVLQASYVIGASASALLYALRPSSLPTSHT
jgi:hypothetical protein